MAPPPDDILRGAPITARWLNEAKNAPPVEIRGGAGILVKRIGRDLVIEATAKKPPIPTGPSPLATFRVVSATKDGTNKLWHYKGRIQAWDDGTSAWTDTTDTTEYDLRNWAEYGNTSTGTYGNGVAQSDLDAINDSGGGTDGTYDLKPIPNGAYVRAERIAATAMYWFERPNAVTGDCPVPA